MILVKISLIILLLLFFWLCWKYTLLIIVKHNADECFDRFFQILKEHIEFIHKFLCEYSISSNINYDKINETQQLILKLSNFSIEKDSNERIIGYANAIQNNLEELLTVYKDIENNSLTYAKYLESEKMFEREKNKYNSTIKTLRHYIDVFPTSFIARLKGFKTFDYIN